jgi:hypothetical protein
MRGMDVPEGLVERLKGAMTYREASRPESLG